MTILATEQRLAVAHGFQPAFFDFLTQTIYLSLFADGRPAPFHILEGAPRELVSDRAPSGRVLTLKPTVMVGYERNGFFFTRASAIRAIADWCGAEA